MRSRYVQVDGVLHKVDPDWTPEPKSDYHVMGDIQPYQSMIDGTMITSRSHHRAHLRQHNCVEVGNDSSLHRAPKPLSAPPGLKEDIIRAVNEVERKIRR